MHFPAYGKVALLPWHGCLQILKAMKLTALLLLIGCLHVGAAGFSQTVSFSVKNEALTRVIDKIEAQTGYIFVYDKRLIAHFPRVNLSVDKLPLQVTLEKLFSSRHLAYAITDEFIVLSLRPDPKTAPASPPVTVVVPITVKGTVLDENNEPIEGVSVVVKGKSLGTSTNAAGEFSLPGVDEGAVLVFSYTGFSDREVKVTGTTPVSIVLERNVKGMNEIVVVGYGTQKKVNLTGAVSVVSSKELTQRPVGQTSAALQGMAPGVTVVQSSGKPGGDQGTIRIRGIGTIGAGQEPLILVDGIEAPINSIDPNLIQSISVLKDAASASIYGSRAANGVVLVTTKRARGGKTAFNYNAYLGLQRPTNLPDMTGAVDHMIMTNEAYVNVGRSPLYDRALIDGYAANHVTNPDAYPDTDWQNEVLTGSGLMQNHFFSLNGGGEKVRFLASLGYFDQKGIIENSGFKRYTLRNNVDIKLSEKLSAQFDLQIVHTQATEPGRGSEDVFQWMNRIPANQVGVNSNGSWGEGWNGDNPIAFSKDGGTRVARNPSAFLNASLLYKPVKWLSVELRAAPRYSELFNKNFNKSVQTYKPDGSTSFLNPARSTLSEVTNRNFFNNFRGTATFDKTYGDHALKVLAGASREDYRNDSTTAFRDNFVLPDYPVLSSGAAANQQATGSAAEWALQSFFGRINYDFKEKYLVEINGRYDGSSRFAEGKKYGFFPSFSAGWRISEEPFMDRFRNVFDEVKIRASWGTLGNQNIGNYPFTSIINMGSYMYGRQITTTASLNNMANPNISWETTEMLNLGIDAALFNNRLSVTAEYYQNQTRDILLNLNIPMTVGLNAPAQNAGKVSNKGWDLGIVYRSAPKKFRYDIALNLSDVRNKVIDLKGINQNSLTQNREGYPINSIYGLIADGYFQDQSDVDKHATQFGIIKPGDLRYVDQNGDGIINDDDNVIIGSTIPRYTYSMNFNAGFKGFSLNFFLQGVGKADGYLREYGIMPFFNGGTVQEQHKNHWTPENTRAAFPRLAFNEPNNEKNSTFWLKNASYLRLKNVQLGYEVPAGIVSRSGISRLRFYISASNLLTWDSFWDGYDVESPVGTGNSYPQLKMYTLGLDLSF